MERTFQAPAEAVFDAWTSEEVLRRWWHAEHDWETTEAEVDLRVGGAVRVVMRDPDKDVEYGGGGNYTRDRPADPPRVHLDLGRRPERDADRDRLRGERRRHHRPLHPQWPLGRGGGALARGRLGQLLRQPRARPRRIAGRLGGNRDRNGNGVHTLLDAVTAEALGVVERGVGRLEQGREDDSSPPRSRPRTSRPRGRRRDAAPRSPPAASRRPRRRPRRRRPGAAAGTPRRRPGRAARSCAGSRASRRPTSRSTASPTACPCSSLIPLKWSMSATTTLTGSPVSAACSATSAKRGSSPRRLSRPVS